MTQNKIPPQAEGYLLPEAKYSLVTDFREDICTDFHRFAPTP